MNLNATTTMDVNIKETFHFAEKIKHTTMSSRRTSYRFFSRMATSISTKTRCFESHKEVKVLLRKFATLVRTVIATDVVRKMLEKVAI